MAGREESVWGRWRALPAEFRLTGREHTLPTEEQWRTEYNAV